MRTLAENIKQTIDDFDGIQNAIMEKGVAVPAGTPTREYGDKIRQISGGGVTTSPPDPKEVYKATRPADWFPMPEVSEDEIYLLFHLSPPAQNLIAFLVNCTGAYTVEAGTVSEGLFVPVERKTIEIESIFEGAVFEGTFDYGDWADETSIGMRQVMLRITGKDITRFETCSHSGKNDRKYRAWNIMEFRGNLPNCEFLMFDCSYRDIEYSAEAIMLGLQKMRYFSLEGENNISSFYEMFLSCFSLIAVLALDTSKGGNFGGMFFNCRSLMAIPELNLSNGTYFRDMFNSCYSLTALPMLDTSNGTKFGFMFYCCTSLVSIQGMDMRMAEDLYGMFFYCHSIVDISWLNFTGSTDCESMLHFCNNLMRLLYTGDGDSWISDLNLECSSVTATALEELFHSLPVVPEGVVSRTIYIDCTPASKEFDDDPDLAARVCAIAAGKRFAISY